MLTLDTNYKNCSFGLKKNNIQIILANSFADNVTQLYVSKTPEISTTIIE